MRMQLGKVFHWNLLVIMSKKTVAETFFMNMKFRFV